MKYSLLVSMLMIVMLTGCVAVDPGIEKIEAMKAQSAPPDKRVTIELLSKEGKNYPLQVIKDGENGYLIPYDKIRIRYEYNIN